MRHIFIAVTFLILCLQAKEQGTYVQSLLDLKDKYDKLLAAAFNNDKTFQHSLNQAFEYPHTNKELRLNSNAFVTLPDSL